jgi:hypothetical protein
LDTARQNAAAGAQFRDQPESSRPPPTDTAFDRLIADLRPQYETWQKDPLVGQPVFDVDEKLAPELLAAQREMLVLLKLHRKLVLTSAGLGPRPRVTSFDRNLGRQVVISTGKQAAPASFDEFARRLSDPGAQPIATLDVDGSVLLSTDTRRLEERLGRAGEYSFARRDDQLVLVRQLASGPVLQGWLESNPKQSAQPLARFALVTSRPQSKSTSGPAVREARRNSGD